MEDIKLMSDKYGQEGESKADWAKFKKPSFWSKLCGLILALTVLLAGGLFSYKYYLENKKEALAQEVAQIEDQRNKELENDLISAYQKSQILQQLMSEHIYASRIFNMLEELLLPRVRVTALDFKLDQATLVVGIETTDYTSLASQLSGLQEDPRIENTQLNKVSLDNRGKTLTRLKIFMNTGFLKGPMNQS